MATWKLRNYRAAGVVSDYGVGREATILIATASEYVTELVAKVEAGDSAFPSFPKSNAGPV